MADVDAPGDNEIPNFDEGEQAGDDDPIPRPLRLYFEGWHRWFNLIVHRGADVAPRRTPAYTEYYIADESAPAPFPLNLDEPWYCGALIAIIIALHHGADRGWLFETTYPYPRWMGRVLGRALLTLGAAVVSTLSFEVVGSFVGIAFYSATVEIENHISTLLVKHLHWGEVGDDGEPLRDDNDDFIWIRDPTYRREPIRDTLGGLAILLFGYIFTFFLEMGNQLIQPFIEWVVGPVLYFFFEIPTDLIPRLLSWLFLPTPGLDKIRDPQALWFEYGVPIVIQFWLLILLWLLEILYIAKAERLALQGWQVIDPKMTIIWQLIRATAMHLLAYTAYQLVCGSIAGIKSGLPQESWYITIIDGPIVPFLGRIIPNGRIFAAALLFFFHWLLRAASVFVVRHAWSFWIPYILWQTPYSEDGAFTYWPFFLEFLVDDLTVRDPTKRVISRVTMTALFGLRSSWPARFHLSNVIDDN
ncbi:hypothetical protein SAMD00023353_2801340 [Rosellinia necatrix]|uniref:Uncharacterized protein n=1 Tax=Rosellinia necatrix TaxID=77044 RepID=A0A1W2TI18_ROSNE|nr:hypothetical protein SAMD00023353_2801340 [Rosellinia necatrix]